MFDDDETAKERTTALATRPVALPTNAAGASDQSRAMAEIQAMVVVAQQCPRDTIRARDRILAAFTRPKLARAALYQYARGGTNVTGPSIRAAEAIAQNWGNMKFGIRELDQRYGASTVEAFAWDLETNTQESRTFQVDHKISTKKGMKTLEDPRDIYELTANQGARRMRACILAIVPSDVTDDVIEQVQKTLSASIKITPELVKSIIDKFEAIGVPKSALEANIQRRLDEKALTPALVIRLSSIYNSIDDGMSTPADYFDIAPTTAEDGAKTVSRTAQAIELLSKGNGLSTAFDVPTGTNGAATGTAPQAEPPATATEPAPEPGTAGTPAQRRAARAAATDAPIVEKVRCEACKAKKGEPHGENCPVDETDLPE